jgi:hypothetical protein
MKTSSATTLDSPRYWPFSTILCLPFCYQTKNYLFTSISAAVRKIFSYTKNCTVVVMMAGVAFCA